MTDRGKAIVSIFTLAFALNALMPSSSSRGQPTDPVHSQQALEDQGPGLSLPEQKRELLAQLDELEKRLALTTSQVDTLSADLARLSSRKSKLEAELQDVKRELAATRKKAESRLRALYKFSTMNYALLLTTVHDLHTAIQAVTAIARLLEEDRKTFASLRQKRLQIESMQATLDEYQWQYRKLSKELEDQNRDLLQAKDAKIRLLIEVNRSIRKRNATDFPSGSSGLSAEPARRHDTTGPVLKPFTALKGRLPLPVPGKICITFGRKKCSQYGNVLYNNGVLIATTKDEPVRAVSSGQVVFADRFRGYGKIMIIDHGRHYYTLMAPLEKLLKKPGDFVAAGEEVATAGALPTTAGPKLYFEIRYHDQPVDPSQWLNEKQ